MLLFISYFHRKISFSIQCKHFLGYNEKKPNVAIVAGYVQGNHSLTELKKYGKKVNKVCTQQSKVTEKFFS